MSERLRLSAVEPTVVTIGETELKLHCTLRAVMLMEERLGVDYQSIVQEILQTPDADGEVPPPMPYTRSIEVVRCLLEAGRTPVSREEMEGLHVSETEQLMQAAIHEMLLKAPLRGEKKTAAAE